MGLNEGCHSCGQRGAKEKCSSIPITHCTCGELHKKHEPIKKAKKEKTVKEKKRKKIEDLIFQKTLKPFNVAKCKLINETIRGKYGDLFPLGNKPIVGVKIHVYCFFLAPKRIV